MLATRYPLVVFDWDGTLADSEAKIVGCLAACIAGLGWEPRPATVLRSIIGLGLPETVPVLFPGAGERDVAAFVAEYRRHWLDPQTPRTCLFAGVVALLTRLKNAGHRLAIATGKSRAGLARELAETGVEALFEATRCADETRSKPDPRMLQELLALTGVDRSEALVVGDTTYDLQMASTAGVASLGVTWGVHPEAQLRRWQPLALVDTIEGLGAWFEQGLAAHEHGGKARNEA